MGGGDCWPEQPWETDRQLAECWVAGTVSQWVSVYPAGQGLHATPARHHATTELRGEELTTNLLWSQLTNTLGADLSHLNTNNKRQQTAPCHSVKWGEIYWIMKLELESNLTFIPSPGKSVKSQSRQYITSRRRVVCVFHGRDYKVFPRLTFLNSERNIKTKQTLHGVKFWISLRIHFQHKS